MVSLLLLGSLLFVARGAFAAVQLLRLVPRANSDMVWY